MGLLTGKLPDTVVVNGMEYALNTDYRIAIRFEEMLLAGDGADEDVVRKALELFYPVVPPDLGQAVDFILWFYSGGKEGQNNGGPKTGAAYSFEEDDEYIYSAFLDQYGIDLQEVEYLHWWRFKAMFKALKDDNEIVKIIGYRGVKITSDMPDGQKKFYRDMKKRYRLKKVTREDEAMLTEVESILLGTGDLSELNKKRS